MKRIQFVIWAIVLFAPPLVSLGLARLHPFGDAHFYRAQPAWPTLLPDSSAPPQVRAILVAKCADCHSTLTRAPLYAHFAPASWLMESDIIRARSAMNLAEWKNFSTGQQEALKAKIAHQVRMHAMPPIQYRLMHWNARLSDVELHTLLQWDGGSGAVSETIADNSQSGDAVRGKAVFERRCSGCHALNANHEGPQLADVYGRISGTAPNFNYSPALKAAHLIWNGSTLDRWLTDPDAFVPNNNMDFHVASPQERRDIIEFLRKNGR